MSHDIQGDWRLFLILVGLSVWAVGIIMWRQYHGR
jgi:hypothetical protein